MSPGERLARRIAAALPELVAGTSRFGAGARPAWFAGRRAIAHLHEDGDAAALLDVRLPRVAQRALAGDPRVVPRRSASAWIEVRVATDDDVDDALAWIRAAAAQG